MSGISIFSFLTFLLSKEWLVYEHELLSGMAVATILTYAVIKFGTKISAAAKSEIEAHDEGWEHWRNGNIELLEKIQTHYKAQLDKSAEESTRGTHASWDGSVRGYGNQSRRKSMCVYHADRTL